jgi:hypothetical protein
MHVAAGDPGVPAEDELNFLDDWHFEIDQKTPDRNLASGLHVRLHLRQHVLEHGVHFKWVVSLGIMMTTTTSKKSGVLLKLNTVSEIWNKQHSN